MEEDDEVGPLTGAEEGNDDDDGDLEKTVAGAEEGEKLTNVPLSG